MAGGFKLERDYQKYLKEKIQRLLPGCVIFKMDQIQGIPDLLILHGDRWGMLECKISEKANRQPNQDYYVKKFDSMSFASFIYPEIEEDVLDELQQSL